MIRIKYYKIAFKDIGHVPAEDLTCPSILVYKAIPHETIMEVILMSLAEPPFQMI